MVCLLLLLTVVPHTDASLMQRVFCDNQELAFDQQWSPSQQQQQQCAPPPPPQSPSPPPQLVGQEQLGQTLWQGNSSPDSLDSNKP